MALLDSITHIRKSALVRDSMSTKVVALPPDASVWEAMVAMDRDRISGIVVADAGRPVGLVSERDLISRVFLKRRDPKKTRLRAVMTSGPRTVDPDTTLLAAGALMKRHKVRRLVVVDREGCTAGILSQTDIVSSLNAVYAGYKTLLWNPWVSIGVFLLISLLILLNYFVFRT